MKQIEIKDLQPSERIASNDMANVFNVYDDAELGFNYKTYSINRTINFVGIDNISSNLYSNYEVKMDDTWALISYKKYGTTRLWWLVCKMNSIFNPCENPIVGTKVKILKDEFVQLNIGSN